MKPGTVINDIVSGLDWFPTLAAAAGVADIKQKLLTGYQAGNKSFKVHLDGYDLGPAFKGAAAEWPRKEIFYFSDDGDLACLRYNRWKVVFAEQRAEGFKVWQEPLVRLRFPKLIDRRGDPFEKADFELSYYDDWRVRHAFLMLPAAAYVGQFLATFRDFPPRQRPASF